MYFSILLLNLYYSSIFIQIWGFGVLGLAAELFGDVFRRRERVLDDVVQEARANARGVETQVGDDPGYADRMHDVRLTRLAGLPGVHPEAIVVCSLDEIGVGRRLVRPDWLY